MGCQALLPGLCQAANAVLAQPQRRVVVLTVELCTLHFQPGHTLKNRLGSALFADGASAAVVAYGDGGWPGPRLLDSLTHSDYHTQEHMAFHPATPVISSSAIVVGGGTIKVPAPTLSICGTRILASCRRDRQTKRRAPKKSSTNEED
jgi:3-oxoacyl-[acyl-carrier-protein] synthase III